MGGPNSGHNTINETTTVYNGVSASHTPEAGIEYEFGPNPVKSTAFIYFTPNSVNNITGVLYNENGAVVADYQNLQPSIQYPLDLSELPAGVYFLHLNADKAQVIQKIVKVKR